MLPIVLAAKPSLSSHVAAIHILHQNLIMHYSYVTCMYSNDACQASQVLMPQPS